VTEEDIVCSSKLVASISHTSPFSSYLCCFTFTCFERKEEYVGGRSEELSTTEIAIFIATFII